MKIWPVFAKKKREKGGIVSCVDQQFDFVEIKLKLLQHKPSCRSVFQQKSDWKIKSSVPKWKKRAGFGHPRWCPHLIINLVHTTCKKFGWFEGSVTSTQMNNSSTVWLTVFDALSLSDYQFINCSLLTTSNSSLSTTRNGSISWSSTGIIQWTIIHGTYLIYLILL